MADQHKNARNRIRYAQEKHRVAVLKRARELARSGRHSGSENIVAELEAMEGFGDARAKLADPELHAQLDKLCTLARTTNRT